MNTKPAGKYAVLFRVHFWDNYVERQYKRLCSVVGKGDVFILVSETDTQVPHPNVIYHKQKSALELGLGGAVESGPFFWFNGDYPLYIFYKQHDYYDYYIMTDYDAVIQRSLDDIVDQLERKGIEFVGQTKGEAVANWPHLQTCLDAYSQDQIQKRLICIAMFTNRAIRHLFARRVAMSTQYKAGVLRRWPYCEAFVPTELALAGLKMAELSEFGPTDYYDWRPPVLEIYLPTLAQQGFVHPVLDLQHSMQRARKSLPRKLLTPWKLIRLLLFIGFLPLAQRLRQFVTRR